MEYKPVQKCEPTFFQFGVHIHTVRGDFANSELPICNSVCFYAKTWGFYVMIWQQYYIQMCNFVHLYTYPTLKYHIFMIIEMLEVENFTRKRWNKNHLRSISMSQIWGEIEKKSQKSLFRLIPEYPKSDVGYPIHHY